MARTVTYIEAKTAEYEVFQAIATEQWAATYEQEPMYPDGVRPSTICAPEAEQKLTTFINETVAGEV